MPLQELVQQDPVDEAAEADPSTIPGNLRLAGPAPAPIRSVAAAIVSPFQARAWQRRDQAPPHGPLPGSDPTIRSGRRIRRIRAAVLAMGTRPRLPSV
ncbi:hypothetical protein GCM10009527_078450 [Actinomadura nitritigenes]|uniref:hypothetical protein n=1 Tax=Actinomadura nitritigenes TaxID=134602 RepID=UPI001FB84A64|nr:hypothetical protein [Actinomadura nitritigenes]